MDEHKNNITIMVSRSNSRSSWTNEK